MDTYSRPYIIPNNNVYNPFPHSLLRTREKIRSPPRIEGGRRPLGISHAGNLAQGKIPDCKPHFLALISSHVGVP